MFFISESLAKTICMTLEDLMYRNDNREVFVSIHPTDYDELANRIVTPDVVSPYRIDHKPKIWDFGSFKARFLTSREMERGTIFIFQDHHITIVNLIQKSNNGEEKNPLP